jgi:hypothetical protein
MTFLVVIYKNSTTRHQHVLRMFKKEQKRMSLKENIIRPALFVK